MVRTGETYKEGKIVFKIVEVIPTVNVDGSKELLIGYRIIDGGYVSPIAHFWMKENEDIRDKIREIVEFYKEVAHCVYPDTIEKTFADIRKDLEELKKGLEEILKQLKKKEKQKKS